MSIASDQDTRAAVARNAVRHAGSQAWCDGVAKGSYPAGSNKCNLFVSDVLGESNASPGFPNGHWFWTHYPPTAGQWADPSYAIPHWFVLPATAAPLPGDVVAQAIAYSDASGHVMIVGLNGNFVGTGDSTGGPHGTIELIPRPPRLGPRPTGPMVFRRWDSAH